MDAFHTDQPIFKQIRHRLVDMIVSGTVEPGDALPSVRQIAGELSVNPLTVTKAFEALVDLGVVEKRRGMGMFVAQGAAQTLLEHERNRFLAEEWPRIAQRIAALGLRLQDLIDKEPGA